jgi:hypothetical protein
MSKKASNASLSIVIVKELRDLPPQLGGIIGLLRGGIFEDGALGVSRQGTPDADHCGAQALEDVPLVLSQTADLVSAGELGWGHGSTLPYDIEGLQFIVGHCPLPSCRDLKPPWR